MDVAPRLHVLTACQVPAHQLVGSHNTLSEICSQRLRRKVQRVERLVRYRRPYAVQPAALIASAGTAGASIISSSVSVLWTAVLGCQQLANMRWGMPQ